MQREITFIKIKCIVKIFISFWRLWAKKSLLLLISGFVVISIASANYGIGENPSYYIKVACYGIRKGWKSSYQFIIQKIKNFVLIVIKDTVT